MIVMNVRLLCDWPRLEMVRVMTFSALSRYELFLIRGTSLVNKIEPFIATTTGDLTGMFSARK